MYKIRHNFGLWIALFLIMPIVNGCISLPQNQKYSELEERVAKIEKRVDKIEEGNEESLILDKKVSAQEPAAKQPIRYPSNKDIQAALKNTGLYNGKIDGRIGTKTRYAISEFQKQNGLEADGVVGRNTWEALSKFYYMSLEAEEVGKMEDEGVEGERFIAQD